MSKQLCETKARINMRFAHVIILLLLISIPALAQTGTGVIRGVVRDANQAVVPGAAVTE